MRAETGVGPSIASGNQVWSGSWADLAIGAAEQAERDEVDGARRELPGRRRRRTSVAKSSVPVLKMIRKSASAIVASPIAFMMNAFLAAATASGRSW